MEKENLEHLISSQTEQYKRRSGRIETFPITRRGEIQKRLAKDCYHLYKLLQEVTDSSINNEWLRKMIDHYKKGKERLYVEGKWSDIQAFDRMLEAAIILEDKSLLKNLAEWGKDPYGWDGRLDFSFRRMLLNIAIIENDPVEAGKYLEHIQSMGSYDSFTKTVFGNVREVYEAILARDEGRFEQEVSEMKKRWKRTKEGKKYTYCSWETLYRGLFEIYKNHGQD